MKSIAYRDVSLSKSGKRSGLRPAFDADVALTRLDERIARSRVDGELVHLEDLEDLVLHDDIRDIRTPTHELTIARDVLRTRRRVAAQLPGWALSTEGIRMLRKTSEITAADTGEATTDAIRRSDASDPEGEGEDIDDIENLSGVDYAAIDAVSPDRRRRSKTQAAPAAEVAKTKIR